MSKAFVNEDVAVPEPKLQRRELVDPGQNYMTPQGLEHLRQDLAKLKSTDSNFLQIEQLIQTAIVIDPIKQTGDRVIFGATVKVRNQDDETQTYKLVGAVESNAKVDKISVLSPIGKSLLQAQVGDSVTVRTPNGEEELEVVSIEFKEIK